MLHEPQLLLLDEPTAGVDPKARRDFGMNPHLAADGMTVLVSTHYMDEAERCHRLGYIAYGKLLACKHAERADPTKSVLSPGWWKAGSMSLPRFTTSTLPALITRFVTSRTSTD